MKTPVKVSVKVQRITGALSRIFDRGCQSSLGVFLQDKIIFGFFWQRDVEPRP